VKAGWRAVFRRSQGWIVIAIVTLIPLVIWLAAADLAVRFGDPAAILKSLANLSALTGTAMFSANMLLAARTRLIERVMGEFDQLYRVHRALGYAVPLVLAAHAFLVAGSKAMHALAEGLALFTPAAGWRIFIGVIALIGLLIALIIPLLRGLSHEAFMVVHRAAGVMFLLGGLHVLVVPVTWTLPLPLIVYLLALMGLGVLAFLYRSLAGRVAVRRYRYEVEAVNPLCASAVELVLAPLDAPLMYQPGQFVFATILADDLPREAHPFSIASAPHEARMRIVVKSLGNYTARLLRLTPGGTALLEGAYGGFSYMAIANKRQVWIAGGIGVTPFLSMARSLGQAPYDIDFYYCTEIADDAFFIEDLYAVSDQNLHLRVIPIRKVSLGHITAGDIAAVSGGKLQQDILMCGPPAMLHNLRTQFIARGVPPERIHF
jgi:predicted ferric reductase